MYKYIAQAWRNRSKETEEATRQSHILWRKQNAIVAIDNPARLDRAHALGYKAKQGYSILRVRVRRGGLRRMSAKRGRRQAHSGVTRYSPAKSMRLIAEERVAKRFPNMEVLNSYYAGEDGEYKWFEVILVDPHHPVIISDSDINWICDEAQRGRVFRGLTSAGKRIKAKPKDMQQTRFLETLKTKTE